MCVCVCICDAQRSVRMCLHQALADKKKKTEAAKKRKKHGALKQAK